MKLAVTLKSLPQSCSLSLQLSRRWRPSSSEGVVQEGRKMKISFHNYKPTGSGINFHKCGNVIFFKGIVAKAPNFIIGIASKWRGKQLRFELNSH